jgi:hypothetical protein
VCEKIVKGNIKTILIMCIVMYLLLHAFHSFSFMNNVMYK